MIVCDECRDVTKRAFDCGLILEKSEPTGPKKEDASPRRMRTREVVKIPLALCEGCITKVCQNLGRLKHKGDLSGQKPKTNPEVVPVPEPESDSK